MEINGLPLHPLVVHAAVVFGPLSALAALVYLVPSWRDRLRWPMVGLVLLAVASVWTAYLTGSDFLESRAFFRQGELGDQLERHQELAGTLRLIVTGFGIVAVLSAALHRRAGAARVVLGVLLGLGAVGTVVWTVLTGDAASQAVWGNI